MTRQEPFSLSKALAGAKVVNGKGKIATQVTDFNVDQSHNYPVIAVIDGKIQTFTRDGQYFKNKASDNDLFIEREVTTEWVNLYSTRQSPTLPAMQTIYRGVGYSTRELADQFANCTRVACLEVIR